MKDGIVVTGIGIVSPVGIGKDAFWSSLINGRPNFHPISVFDASAFRTNIAGEATEFNPSHYFDKRALRDMDRSTQLICAAAKLAIDDSKLEITDGNSGSIGVSVGSTFGSLRSISEFDRVGLVEGPRSVNPSRFPNTVLNSPASQVSIKFKIKGFNTTISTGFCASLDALCYATNFIRLGRANAVLAGGVEELCEETFRMFYEHGMLSGSDGSKPICCPFDARRNGFIFSEGSGALMIEKEEEANKRGAVVLAKILGYGIAFDPTADFKFSRPRMGIMNAIALALKDADISLSDLDCICSCSNSSQGLDSAESLAITELFGDERAYTIPISAPKSVMGEAYSASGVLLAAAAVGSLQKGFFLPTVNHFLKRLDCFLYYVPNKARAGNPKTVLVTSSDPYGQSTAMILGK